MIKSVFTLLLFSSLTFAQNNYRTIRGKVYDQKTKEPVPYAHVGILDKGIGTTTSDNGIFVLKVPETSAAKQFGLEASSWMKSLS